MAVVVVLDAAGHVVESHEVASGLIHKGDVIKVCAGGGGSGV